MQIVLANIPVPADCFLHRLAKIRGRQRWKDAKGWYYEWDRLHGHAEVYGKSGRHIGAMNKDGKMIEGPVSGRRISL